VNRTAGSYQVETGIDPGHCAVEIRFRRRPGEAVLSGSHQRLNLSSPARQFNALRDTLFEVFHQRFHRRLCSAYSSMLVST
jgi:hypothetical protein